VKTILVTGGAGFIGGHFVRWLARERGDWRVVVLDALTYAGSRANLPGDFRDAVDEFCQGDVRDAALVETLVGRADIVVHMAAETHVTRSLVDGRAFFETDVVGTQTVASAVARHRDRVGRFIHISSSEVYGTALTEKIDEQHPLNPTTPYSAAKCGADRLVYAYRAAFDIPAIIVRPFNTFGPRQHLEKAIPRFVTSCLLGEPLVVHGNGSAARDWLFVDDLCAALGRLLEVEVDGVADATINLGTGQHRTILDVAEAVRELVRPEHSPITFVPDRPGQIARHTCDTSRAEAVLRWTATTAFHDGLRRTVDWYREHERWWRPQVPTRQLPIVTSSGQRALY
jgi:dTDP-glucose 4,6-dehydratase